MALLPLEKVGILTDKEALPHVFRLLQKKGIFHPVGKENEELTLPEEWADLDVRLANMQFVLEHLSRYAPAPVSFAEKIRGEKVIASPEALDTLESLDISSIVQRCIDLSDAAIHREAEKARIRELLGVFSLWKKFQLPLSLAGKQGSTEFFLGSIERKDFSDFSLQISQIALVNLQTISEYPDFSYFFLISHESVLPRVQELLSAYRFSPAKFPKDVGLALEEIRALEEEQKKLLDAEEKAEAEWKKMATESLSDIKMAFDALLWKKEKRQVFLKSQQTSSFIFLEGWMVASEIEKTEQELDRLHTYVAIWKRMRNAQDVPPVLLKNHPLIRPFEMVMRLFGLPSHNELDPTPYFAPFFLLFFAFCLTDAGYGVLLSFAFGGALFLPLERGIKDMMKLMLMGSLVTIVMGVLFGGYFGMTTDQFPLLKNPETGLFYGQIFDPMNSILVVMGFAYALGVLHLWLGVILSGVNKWRQGSKGEAICGSGGLAITIVLLAILPFAPLFWQKPITVVLWGLLPILLWGFGSGNHILARMGVGIFGLLNEALSWLSNVLSYSRLFALGLATGVIAMVFNNIANIIASMLPLLLAIPMWIFIILFGHSLNIALNLLGAFIHSARLQFVEFFGKFLDGNGKAFTPLMRRGRYIADPA